MCRRWRRSICGFAIFSPWGEPKLRVGGCPQPAPVWAGGLRQAARGLRLASVWDGGLRQAARGLRLAPVRAGGLRESQWECVELGGGAFGGEAHSGERRIRGGSGAGIGFRPRIERAKASGGAGARDWGAQPVGRRAIPERLLLACSV